LGRFLQLLLVALPALLSMATVGLHAGEPAFANRPVPVPAPAGKATSLLKAVFREGESPAERREMSDFPHPIGSAGASPSLFQQAATVDAAPREPAAIETVPVETAPAHTSTTHTPPIETTPINAAPAYSPQWPEPPNTGAMLLRLCLGTVFVLALSVVSLWLGKPWLKKLQAIPPGGQALRIEGSVLLGNRAVLYLVKVGDTQLVAGTDPTGLKSLIALQPTFKDVFDGGLAAGDATPTVENAGTKSVADFDPRQRPASGG
jgi:flagellar biogenesis protein FliO